MIIGSLITLYVLLISHNSPLYPIGQSQVNPNNDVADTVIFLQVPPFIHKNELLEQVRAPKSVI